MSNVVEQHALDRSPDFASQLRSAVANANIPVLLMVLIHLTGQLGWLDEKYRPVRQIGVNDNDDGGLPSHIQDEIRSAACTAIMEWHAGKPLAIKTPNEDLVLRMLSVAMGEEIPSEYGPMLLDDLAPYTNTSASDDTRIAVPEGFSAVIVGAGVSGICAAVALHGAGIPYQIFEASGRIGGVWEENRYPGAGVDTPSHLYSFSFADYEWSQFFALRAELQEYLEHVAETFDVRRHIEFGTRVTKATYDTAMQGWVIDVERQGGSRDTIRSNVLISAVGIFNPPQYPALRGLGRFSGPMFHTARWPSDINLAGKRVAIIGNGASAMQIAPAIAEDVASLVIFQRSKHWVMPFEKFQVKVPEATAWLHREVPMYRAWYRLRLAWTFNDKVHPMLQKDPAWPHPERSLNRRNDRFRAYLTEYAKEQLGGHQNLLEKVLPDYPPFGKRMLLDNGWFRTLLRSNVQAVTDPIREVVDDGIITTTDTPYPVDILIIATGFDVAHFLTSFPIYGRSGHAIQEHEDDIRAYLGTVIPDLPNFFCMYGPNTQPGHGGSIMYTIETQTHYMISLLRQMFANGIKTAECKQEVCDRFNAAVDEANSKMVWTHPGMRTYYRNSKGRVVVNSPYRNVDWWYMVRSANLEEYILEPAGPQ